VLINDQKAPFWIKSMVKILIISGSGMGCGIMFAPTLRALRQKFPRAEITFLGLNKSFVAPFAGSDLVSKTVVFDFAKDSLWQISQFGRRLKALRELRRQKFDYSLTVFPSNKWHFNAFAWLVGARARITHSYETSSLKSLAWLQNRLVPADPKLHDVEQNLNLLKVFGINPLLIKNRKLYFHVTDKARSQAADYIAKNNLSGKKFIGMHIGSSQDFAFASKRWPTEKFARLADKIQSELKTPIMVFAGPDEKTEVEAMVAPMRTKPLVVATSLDITAALIESCCLMVSNDSGLMHIAVAMTTPVVAIFGPTSVTRTRPYTDQAEVIYDPKCNSLLKYPFLTTSAKIDSAAAAACFRNISVARVYEAVKKYLHGKI
jgi:ADP-heptose:LPS heptosyltransferase